MGVMNNVLILDASTEARCSAALCLGEEIFVRGSEARRGHEQNMLRLAKQALSEGGCALSDLDGIAFACGPGSFTGVRVCAATAQGLAMGVDLPLLPLSSLALIAQGWVEAGRRGLCAPILDARQQKVYWGLYRGDEGAATACVDDACAPIAQLAEALREAAPTPPVLIGAGCEVLRDADLSPAREWSQALPEARFGRALVASAAADAWLPPERAHPTYLSGWHWRKSAAAS